ncbi:MAG TPA: DUF488 domain-containing protein [Candidatus Aquilonibacter sp.]|nr:DUF488 domain-containing protein [Candidatus Aquilonibacter sp.]
MEVYSIGFTKKTAEQFFGTLKNEGIRRLLDVRLNNISQLAGFAKRDDLRYFLREICSADYIHQPLLAPTQDMLDDYKKRRGTWQDYERRFLALMSERKIEEQLDPSVFAAPTVLLCSELKADHCHRRLVLEYLAAKWGNITTRHL